MKTQIDRLGKLAGHLLREKLGLDRFDFTMYYGHFECRTQGCAIGECPTVFPEDWEFNKAKCPVLKNRKTYTSSIISAMEFFGLSVKEYIELFVPGADAYVTGVELGKDASKEAVAGRILLFCQIKSQQQPLGMDDIEMLRPACALEIVGNYPREEIDEETLELAEI